MRELSRHSMGVEVSMDDRSLESTIAILRAVPGGPELLDWFHGWPEFGDAELLEVHLVRGGPSLVRLFVTVSAAGQYAGPPLKSGICTLYFGDMLDISVEGFSHQNVIGGLMLQPARSIQVHPSLTGLGLVCGSHELALLPCAGAFGTIRGTLVRAEIVAAIESDH
jgi:hypothetical protein